MHRIFELIINFTKTASTSHSVSRFQTALIKGSSPKSARKSIEVKIHYRQSHKQATVDVDEFTKAGHKHRCYELENIDRNVFKKMESLISKGHWGMFFALVNKHRIVSD
jgi:hypothetical protein